MEEQALEVRELRLRELEQARVPVRDGAGEVLVRRERVGRDEQERRARVGDARGRGEHRRARRAVRDRLVDADVERRGRRRRHGHVRDVARVLAVVDAAERELAVRDGDLGRGLEGDADERGADQALRERVVDDGRDGVPALGCALGEIDGADAGMTDRVSLQGRGGAPGHGGG